MSINTKSDAPAKMQIGPTLEIQPENDSLSRGDDHGFLRILEISKEVN